MRTSSCVPICSKPGAQHIEAPIEEKNRLCSTHAKYRIELMTVICEQHLLGNVFQTAHRHPQVNQVSRSLSQAHTEIPACQMSDAR